jgi:LytS/YehU family sensor histidine kinase
LQNSEAALIPLESELESVKLYLSLEALRFDDHFEYKLSVDPDLDISALKVPPLIIQPYAENAVWHGLMHKEEKGQLDIELWQESDFLYFKIVDNGVGRKQAVAMASKTATRNKSMGLAITASRIARMQPDGDLGSPVVINDLIYPDGTAAGTEVIIKLPIIFD